MSRNNRAWVPYDYDNALDNDTSRKDDGAEEAGGTPMRYCPVPVQSTFTYEKTISVNQCWSARLMGQAGFDWQIFL